MNASALKAAFAVLLMAGAGVAMACDFKPGETKFLDYANCQYGEENIQVIVLPEGSNWDQCIYQVQAFRPEKLLAVTKDQNGKEKLSINDRSQIGNPCYMTKKLCDSALTAYNASH